MSAAHQSILCAATPPQGQDGLFPFHVVLSPEQPLHSRGSRDTAESGRAHFRGSDAQLQLGIEFLLMQGSSTAPIKH